MESKLTRTNRLKLVGYGNAKKAETSLLYSFTIVSPARNRRYSEIVN